MPITKSASRAGDKSRGGAGSKAGMCDGIPNQKVLNQHLQYLHARQRICEETGHFPEAFMAWRRQYEIVGRVTDSKRKGLPCVTADDKGEGGEGKDVEKREEKGKEEEGPTENKNGSTIDQTLKGEEEVEMLCVKKEEDEKEEKRENETTLEEVAQKVVYDALPAILRKRLTSFYFQWVAEWEEFRNTTEEIIHKVQVSGDREKLGKVVSLFNGLKMKGMEAQRKEVTSIMREFHLSYAKVIDRLDRIAKEEKAEAEAEAERERLEEERRKELEAKPSPVLKKKFAKGKTRKRIAKKSRSASTSSGRIKNCQGANINTKNRPVSSTSVRQSPNRTNGLPVKVGERKTENRKEQNGDYLVKRSVSDKDLIASLNRNM
eukprot:Nk52_evm7s223 gene=Nk52_evmTU7s223